MLKKLQQNPITLKTMKSWFEDRGYRCSREQLQTWKSVGNGESVLLSLPTGSGKTLGAFGGALIKSTKSFNNKRGIRVLYLCPLRSLANDIAISVEELISDLAPGFEVGSRTGDTTSYKKQKYRSKLPEVLITTPESLVLLLSYEDSEKLFETLEVVICDEWHELLQSKRGVLFTLCWHYLKHQNPNANICAMSATLADPLKALKILAPDADTIITTKRRQKIELSVLDYPSKKNIPWSGYMGLFHAKTLYESIDFTNTNLVFCNTRNQAENWFKKLQELEMEPITGERLDSEAKKDLTSSQIALHHGSLAKEERQIVENGLKTGSLKVVVATASLDLGVDYGEVDCVYQIGSPKSLNRLIQRAGRSRHRPGAIPKIVLVPTNGWDLLDFQALHRNFKGNFLESIHICEDAFDVLAQFMLAITSSKPTSVELFWKLAKKTPLYNTLTKTQFDKVLDYLTKGGSALSAYPEYKKCVLNDGILAASEERNHRLIRQNFGTITSDASLRVKTAKGKLLGHVEERFIQGLPEGCAFQIGGKSYKIQKIYATHVVAKPADAKDIKIPSWLGGRLPYSVQLRQGVLEIFDLLNSGKRPSGISKNLLHMIRIQSKNSKLPGTQDFLLECLSLKKETALFGYPFLGQNVNQAVAMVLAARISKKLSGTYEVFVNDYGFGIRFNKPLEVRKLQLDSLFCNQDILDMLQYGIEISALEKMHFRETSRISMLSMQNYFGKQKSGNQLRVSSNLIFDVLKRFESDHIILEQGKKEVLAKDVTLPQCQKFFDSFSIDTKEPLKPHLIEIESLTPLSLPIWTEKLATTMSRESIEEQIMHFASSWEA